MNSDLIIRVKYEGSVYDLDVVNEVPLRIDMSTVEVGELGRLFGIGSQTFTLPGSKNNNRFFKNAYDIGADNPPSVYDSIDGWVIYRGETLLYGQFQLIEIVTDETGFVNYNVQIADKVVQFKEAVEGKFIKDGDWSAYTHTLTSSSIVDSWSGNLLSGSVFYPLAEYGRPDNKQGSDPYPYLGFYQGYLMGTTLRPIQVEQFLPAVKLKDTINVIFDQVGFTATGSFLEKPEYDNLYLLTKANDQFGPVIPSASATFTAQGSGTNELVFLGTTRDKVPVEVESFDPQNAYNTSTYEYTAQAGGEHTFNGSISFFNPNNVNGTVVRIKLELRAGSYPSATTIIETVEQDFASTGEGGGFGPFTLSVAGTTSMTAAADNAWLEISYTKISGAGTPPSLVLLNSSGRQFRCTSAPKAYKGATVDMADQFNAELKSSDIIKALITQFNLVMIPVDNDQSTIQIETFDDWMRAGGQKDWSNKFDTSKRTSITHTINELPKKVILTQAEDNDRLSKITKEQEPYRQYGSLELFATSNNAIGEDKLETVFAPTILGGVYDASALGSSSFDIDTTSITVYPHLYKYENDKILPYGFKPRLGFRVTNNLPSGSLIHIGDPSGGETYTGYRISGSYGTLSNLSQLPGVPGSTIDLHFNNTYTDFGSSALGFNDGIDSFNTYWKTYYDSLYWDDSKKVTMTVNFEPYEYKSIRLNDKILIKNQYYRINKIKGFNVSYRDTATVELVRLYPAYYQPTFQSGSIPSPTPQPSGATPTPSPSQVTPTPSPSNVTPTPSPSSGSLITPTPTITPSITPSLTPGLVYEWEISAGSTNKNQCAAPFTGSVYTNVPGEYWTEYGQALSIDSSLTTRFDGGNRYHRLKSGSFDFVWSINASGLVSEEGPNCANMFEFYGNPGYLTEGNECFGLTSEPRYSADFNDVLDMQVGDRIYANSSLTYELNDGWYYGISNVENDLPQVAFEYSLIAGVTTIGNCDAGIPVSMSSYAFTSTDACQDSSPEFLAYVPQGSDPYNMPVGSRFYSNPQLTSGFGLSNLYYGAYSGSLSTPYVYYRLFGSDPFNGFVVASGSCVFENAYSASRDAGSTIGGEGCYNEMPFNIYMRQPLASIVAAGSGQFYDNELASIVFPGNSGRYSLYQEGTPSYSGSRAIFTINSLGIGTLVEECGERFSFRGRGYLTDGQECDNVENTSYYTMDFTTVQDVEEGDRIYLNAELNTELLDGYYYGITDTSGSLPEKAFEYYLITGVTNLGSCDAGSPISMSSYGISAFEACQDTTWEFTAYIPSGSDPFALTVGDYIYDNKQLTSPFGLNNVYYGIYTSSIATPYTVVRLQNGQIAEVSSCGAETVYSGSTTEGSTIGNEGCFNPPSSSIYFAKPLEQIVATGSGQFYSNAIASVAFPGNSGRYTLHQSASNEYSESRAIFTINSSGQGSLYEICGTTVSSFFGTTAQNLNVDPCNAPLTQTIYTDEFTSVADIQEGSRLYTNATLSNELADNFKYVISNVSASNGIDAGIEARSFLYSLTTGVVEVYGSCNPSSSMWYGTSFTSTPEDACNFTTPNLYFTNGAYNIFELQGKLLYTNSSLTTEISANNQWIGLGYNPSPATANVRVYYVNGSGIQVIGSCNEPVPSPTPTPTPSIGTSPTPSATPSPSSTPSVSVSPTPTPTPSTTPYTLYTYDATTGQSFDGIVCGLSTTDLLYASASSALTINLGDIIYSDTSYTPFDGGSGLGLYYGLGSGSPQVQLRINSSGVVTNKVICIPPTPSPTPQVLYKIFRGNTGYSTNQNACDSGSAIIEAWANSPVQDLQPGDTIYINSSGTVKFDGLELYWWVEEEFSPFRFRVLSIDETGNVQTVSNCGVPDPSPTPSVTPTISITPSITPSNTTSPTTTPSTSVTPTPATPTPSPTITPTPSVTPVCVSNQWYSTATNPANFCPESFPGRGTVLADTDNLTTATVIYEPNQCGVPRTTDRLYASSVPGSSTGTVTYYIWRANSQTLFGPYTWQCLN